MTQIKGSQSTDKGTSNRKEEHLAICLNYSLDNTSLTTGFEEYRFIHQALPEINLDEVDCSVSLLGKRLKAPLMISPMTGGSYSAITINRNLAIAAQELGIAMGVGSERCLIETPELVDTYRVRDIAPDILLCANLGAVQLNYGYGIRECRMAIEAIEADVLVLHLNPLQEALQPEGTTGFSQLANKIGELCSSMPVPVIVKEVGWGISEDTARKLKEAGVSAIDIAGAGGTTWSEVERFRSNRVTVHDAFTDWGIPTAESLAATRRAVPDLPIIASGGIRSGIDIAKAVALGATATGIAGPLLKPASTSAQAVMEYLNDTIDVLKTAMFCIGAQNCNQLKDTPYLERKRRA